MAIQNLYANSYGQMSADAYNSLQNYAHLPQQSLGQYVNAASATQLNIAMGMQSARLEAMRLLTDDRRGAMNAWPIAMISKPTTRSRTSVIARTGFGGRK